MARRRRKSASHSVMDSSITWTAYNRPDLASYSSRGGHREVPQGAAEFLEIRLRERSTEQERREKKASGKKEGQEGGGKGKHIQSPTPFEKQIARPDIVDGFPDVNENRFSFLPSDSPVHSKTKKVPSPNLAKLLPRASPRGQQQWQAAEYRPNFKLVWKRQTHDFAFEKVVGRKKKGEDRMNPDYHDVSYSQVHSKVPSPDFRRSVPKSRSPQFPTHMQNIVSWQALHFLTDKMLEMNSAYHRPMSPARHFRTVSQ